MTPPAPSLRRALAPLFASALTSILSTSLFGAPPAERPPTITLEVDATDLPRQLLRSTMTIQLPPVPANDAAPEGRRTSELFFVTWTPGNHTPSGPIENVVDLVIKDCRGDRLDWQRDPERMERFTVTLPRDCASLSASFSYIAGQPNPNSRSSDSYGRATFGGVNWNTVLLYPGGWGAPGRPANQEITVAPAIALPSSWAYATALSARTEGEGHRFGALQALRPGDPVRWISFQSVPLAELIDSPLIAGTSLRTINLPVAGAPPHVLALVGAEEKLALPPDWLVGGLGEMCRQGVALFPPRGFPRARYTFLVLLDEGMRFGLEHAESTFVGMAPRSFIDAKRDETKGGGSGMLILAHEYFHAWCGKLRAPEGLVRPDLHTPARTELLWVYEGLTSYYEDLLSVRAGLLTLEEFRRSVRSTAVAMEQRTGRLWRSVEDTARAARHLRPRGLYWHALRQGQEYYGQGAAFWLEADAIIRRGTSGARSLDDFCRAFFDVPVRPVGDQATYTRKDVIAALRAVYDGQDWDGLVRQRIEEPAPALDMGPVLALLGYRLGYAPEPGPDQKDQEKPGSDIQLSTSLGITLNKDGEITDLIPGSPADEAGLGFGMKLLAVDGWVFSADRLRTAIRQSPETGKVALLVSFGDRVEERGISYSAGPRYPKLERIDGAPDILEAIARPIASPH